MEHLDACGSIPADVFRISREESLAIDDTVMNYEVHDWPPSGAGLSLRAPYAAARRKSSHSHANFRDRDAVVCSYHGGSDQVVLKTEAHRGSTRRHSELPKDVLEVPTGSVVADNELCSDFAVALTSRNEP